MSMEAIVTPKPGFYPNVPTAEYHAWEAASNSRLKVIAQKSPFHLHWMMNNRREPSEALALGTAAHAALFEAERFAKEFSVSGPCNATLKSGLREGKSCGADGLSMVDGEWRCGKHGGERQENTISQEQMSFIDGMRESVKMNPTAIQIVRSPGWTEASALWEDVNTGELCKCRFDRLVRVEGLKLRPSDQPWDGYAVPDFKTCSNASDRGHRSFLREAINEHLYHLQSAIYLCGASSALKIHPSKIRFFLIATESSPPHGCRVVEVHRHLLHQGWTLFQNLLRTFQKCKESGVWPGYENSVLEKPEWMNIEEEDD